MLPDLPPAPTLDVEAMRAAQSRQAILTKPAGALGRLEDVSIWMCGVQGVCPPRPLSRRRVVVFAGDHGIARSGVSAYPPEVTAQMVANFAAGGAAVNVLAELHHVGVRVVDLSVAGDLPAGVPEDVRRIARRQASGSIDVEDAITRDDAELALQQGRDLADEEVDAGADLLIAGDMGIGNTTPAAVLAAALTGEEPTSVVGRGTGIDDARWMTKTAAVRDALHRAQPHLGDMVGLLASAGGADFAAMTGFLLQASQRRTPVVLDGVISSVCGLVAERLAPGSARWWVAGTRSTEPAQALALKALGLEPLLDLGLRLGEGTGALVALPILDAAIATLSSMATFEGAGVSDRDS